MAAETYVKPAISCGPDRTSGLSGPAAAVTSVFSERKKWWILLGSLAMLFIAGAWAITCGAYDIILKDVWHVLTEHMLWLDRGAEPNKLHTTIIWNIRLPRLLFSAVVGVALSTAGTVFQGCFRNPLVEPYILGVSSGAACGAAMGIVFPEFFLSVQVLSFIGGTIAVVCTYAMARVEGQTPVITLVLSGIVVGSVFAALVGIMKYIARDAALREIVFWLMGGFYYVTWDDVLLIAPVVAGCFLVIWSMGWKLNVLSMGDQEARSLGVNPERYKLFLMVLATLITSLAVSAVGIIAWVGLMVPHAARMIIGPDHRLVIPLSSVLGAIYLIICDTLARTLTSAEIPIGIITSLVGAPYLFFLLRSKGKAAFGL